MTQERKLEDRDGIPVLKRCMTRNTFHFNVSPTTVEISEEQYLCVI